MDDCIQDAMLRCMQMPRITAKSPSFELDLEMVKANILSNIHDYVKKVTSGVLTRFFFDLALWVSFWLQVTQV